MGREGGTGIAFASNVTVVHGTPLAVARPAYLEQVRRIAPPDPPGLRDRDGELAELARFCLNPGGASYAWWRAGPWAGKSALLSSFVLRPPREVRDRVRLVSFFITARLAAQDTREAFTEVLAEQLAGLTGQQLPAVLPEATREAFLLGLLSQAASECREAGGRLVLVVDGLDEDRGVTTGPDAHSIAGLLPADPPAGMRVIVAGRPNPPVPDDVPDWHPLRDPGIIRVLAESPHARDIGRLGRQELKRLLADSAAGRDVLGLLSAARGGLSGPDLSELAGVPLWEVEEIVQTVAGRTFARRPGRWGQGAGPEVYLLGHEELQAAAVGYLAGQLPGYRDRLHAWAGTWRARGWPPGTPEYLLSGYYQLLASLGDLPRMTGCALDRVRHDRMLVVTGGDAAALAEVRAALDLIAAQDPPDLGAALALACRRDQLAGRNASVPAELPAVWAALGQVTRAEALAASITDPQQRAEALARVAVALDAAGQHQQAATVAGQAEAFARSVTTYSPGWRNALARVARVLAAAGQREQAGAIAGQAEAVARSATGQDQEEPALARIAVALAEEVGTGGRGWGVAGSRGPTAEERQAFYLAQDAGVLAAAGQHEQAAAVAGQAQVIATSSTSPGQLAVLALADAARALAAAGRHEQATAVAGQAEAVAHSITEPHHRTKPLAWVAGALAAAGRHQQAEALARSITHPENQAKALSWVAGALAAAGRHQQAEALARSITHPDRQAKALSLVAGALAAAGRHQQAAAVAGQAEAIARSIAGAGGQARALAQIAESLAGAGRHEQAAAVARSIAGAGGQARALAQIAESLAAAGQHEQAAAVARSIAGPGGQARALAQIAESLAAAGQHEQAEVVARSITDPGGQARALAQIAKSLAVAGQHQQAAAVAGQAEVVARSITDPGGQARALAQIAESLAVAGQHQQAAAVAGQAEVVARSITDPDRGAAHALAEVAGALAAAGQHQQAAAVAGQAEVVARSITDPDRGAAHALADVAWVLATSGRHQQAEVVARSISDPDQQANALAWVAESLAAAGLHEQAEVVARSITDPDLGAAHALARVAGALAAAGRHEQAAAVAAQAEAVARSIPDRRRQVLALVRVAGALAAAGRHEQATAVACSITNPSLQADALAGVAESLARAGDTQSATRLAAAACTAGRWATAAIPVLLLDPPAFTVVAHVLDER